MGLLGKWASKIKVCRLAVESLKRKLFNFEAHTPGGEINSSIKTDKKIFKSIY